MLSIAILDDLPEEVVKLENAVKLALPDTAFDIAAYGSAQDLLASQATGRNADILLIDIRPSEQDGVRIAREVNRISPATQIIFISASIYCALDVYEAQHTYFLMKPVQAERLRAALDCARERIRRQLDARLLLPVKGGAKHILSASEVLYFERQNHVTNAVLDAGVLVTGLKLCDIASLLPPGVFERPHNSYLVNLFHVRAVSRMRIRMENDAEIPISNQKRAVFMQALSESL